MLLGMALVVVALLWARRLRRDAGGADAGLRGPWVMGLAGAGWFLFHVWLITSGALRA